jgi:hypothetical protein
VALSLPLEVHRREDGAQSQQSSKPCDVTVTHVTAINQQVNMLALSGVQPCHWLVGQTLQYAGLGGASLASYKLLLPAISNYGRPLRKRPRPQQQAGQ